ncbi:hypothetical protein A3F34_02650 [Candidatus Roizmanbacteria bacterium RIFCSPHIGHO2_12_FULL_44_10]|uniref:UDP-N-acetylglucosamine--N-acetylmuramyl-(pentapeptide) pyrophosphoryl-undecaprenol N-acetylglucosamine transferase n=1 Tax=Candidatus Roizmanbacteria bacterium RIFCSPHIGHO2_12_FULL_44_10 TaxID=1802054 RepID=A0A1F7I5P6_9BACT|nr:MAG: hypothetical protein A3F34_02650 [Candidatus Roizmanbacteria bacterium RIFCSPHIGHO2_12_FULL_44_10]
MKILITGGHVTPALAVINELKKDKTIAIVFVGRQYTSDSELTLTYEYTQIEKLGIPFIHLTTGKLSRVLALETVTSLFKVVIGLIQSAAIMRKHKPEAILSFGGYLGLPIAIAGYFARIPVYVHEQTIAPGLSNRLIGNIARKIFVSFPETVSLFSKKRTLLTGNPLRPEVFREGNKPFPIVSEKPIIFVMGGSLGSHSINVHIENIISELTKDFVVIHQTGNIAEYNDYERLAALNIKNYHVGPHVYQDNIGWIYRHAAIVVSRAGANTVFELISLQKPSVLIPLPWSAGGEQEQQAALMERAGVAVTFDQSDASAKLLDLIKQAYKNREQYRRNFSKLRHLIQPDAAKKIIAAIIPKPADHERH